MHQFISSIAPSLFALAAVHLISFFWPLPVIIQMILNGGLSVHIGTLISTTFTKASYQQVKQCQQQLRQGSNHKFGWKNVWEIAQYPLIGSVVLLGLYFIIKNSEKLTINTILDLIFMILVTIYGGSRLNILSSDLIQMLKDRLQINQNISNLIQNISKYLFCPLLALLLALLYVTHKHWFLNNLFALFLTISTLKYAGIKTFKLAIPILWSLFVYDLYWVYKSDVMVTVAKGIDLPLKLLFPYLNSHSEIQFSMLGLGDIIVPGLFLSLCFKYDIDNCILGSGRQKLKSFKTPLYYSALILYIIGFCLTYLAMYLMERPQPALVFIVPCLSISLLINKCLGSNRLPLCKYNSSTMAKSQQNGQRV